MYKIYDPTKYRGETPAQLPQLSIKSVGEDNVPRLSGQHQSTDLSPYKDGSGTCLAGPTIKGHLISD